MRTGALELPLDAISSVCRRRRVKQLALFGSALGKRFGPSSDIDLLVEFEEDAEVGFIELAQLQRELSSVLGRRADLVPKGGLKPIIRESILAQAQVLYAPGRAVSSGYRGSGRRDRTLSARRHS